LETTCLAVGLGAVVASLPATVASPHESGHRGHRGDCVSFAASAYGQNQKGPWVGDVYLRIGSGDVNQGTFYDVAEIDDVDSLLKGLPFTGTERNAVTLDSGTFDIVASFVAVPGSTPYHYYLRETGDIENGTGAFVGVSGRVAVTGPFLLAASPPGLTSMPPWIGQMHGMLCGLPQQ
jgi:hypothetical protein